mmetsp:Transcript_962/g.1496  ORF Transcript_962/g.1496 Transcript_962/m.1496 type:complete len:420 (-) Transcript_962:637-1896(-)
MELGRSAPFAFKNTSNEVLEKVPETINGENFSLENLTNCKVYLMDYSAQVSINNCKNSKIFIGPVTGACFVRNCTGCVFSIATQQIRIKDSNESTVFLYSRSNPIIENSHNIRFASYNFAYPKQEEHFKKANLDPSQNNWNNITDISGDSKGYSFLIASNFYEEVKEIPGLPPSENPVVSLESEKIEVVKDQQKLTLAEDRKKIPVGQPVNLDINKNPTSERIEVTEEPQIVTLGEESRSDLRQHVPFQKNREMTPVKEPTVNRAPSLRVQKITCYYRPKIGYQLPNYTQISNIPSGEIQKTLKMLSEKAEPYNEKLRSLFIEGFCGLVGFFVLFLVMEVLRMVVEWDLGVYILAVIIAVGGVIAIESLVVLSSSKLRKQGEDEVQKFIEKEKNTTYERFPAFLRADLRYFEINVEARS